MTPHETARVLAKCSAFDQRTVGGADVAAWHEVIGKLDFADALEAVTRHYAETNHRAMPADIKRIGRMIRDERSRSPHEIRALPSPFESDEERDARLKRGLALCKDVLKPVIDRLNAQRAAEERVVDPVRERALERARRERRGEPA